MSGSTLAAAWPSGRTASAADRPVVVSAATDHDRTAWDRYVDARLESTPDADQMSKSTGYHAWPWREVFERSFGHRSIYLLARRQDGAEIEGVLPLVEIRSLLFGRSLTSMAFLNYGGVVADSAVVGRALVDRAIEIARSRGCGYVELRHVGRRFADLPYKQHKVSMHLALQPGLWDRLDRKVRNQVRKAQKSDLTVVQGGAELQREFYEVFARNMRDLGTPVYGRQLFAEVLAAFPDRAQLVVVRLKDRPIAAALTFRTGRTMEVPWASSVRDFNNLCPNHLLYWTMLESALAADCGVFDFGRSTPNEGPYRFKAQWGAEPVALHWEYGGFDGAALPERSPANGKFQLAIAIWQRLPVWLANIVGPVIVRGIP